MPFNIPFCNITSYSAIYYGEDNVGGAAPGNPITNPVKLTITSINTSLYPITPNDFRVVGAIQTAYNISTYTNIQNIPEIEQVEFVQNGNEVDVWVTLVNGFNMNDLNQTIDFCIEGHPSISTTVTGNIFNVVTPL